VSRENLTDLNAFMAVADEGSFTRAAARLGTSQSALSHTVTRLEARLGVRLLSRTTRSVAPTEAGERLLASLRPALDAIAQGVSSLSELRDKPSGTIRITTSEHAARTILWPVLERLLPEYPEIKVELSIDSAFSDIVTDRFDAGVRLGESIAKDMIAVRIGPELRMVAVASPAYLKAHGTPVTPHDLADHNCINLRFQSSGGLYAWEFEKEGRQLNVRVDGQLIFNNTQMIMAAAKAGLGIAFVMENMVQTEIDDGGLVRILDDWCQPFSGYHLYYPSRRQPSAAFALLVEALLHNR